MVDTETREAPESFRQRKTVRCAVLLVAQLVVSVVVCASPVLDQGSWWKTYGGANDDWGCSAQQTSDGGYIIAGYTASSGAGLYDVCLIKTDTAGDTLWTRTYGGADDDEGLSVQQTADGGYVVAGWTASFGAGDLDVYLIKTNASGDTLWTRTYGDTSRDMGSSVRQTADGGYIIAGWTASFGARVGDVYLIKTNASGDTLWTGTYGDTSMDEGCSVQQTADGGYIIAGWTTSFGAGTPDYANVYLIRTNPSGDTLWTRAYGGTDHDWGESVQQTADGGYIIAGWTTSFGAGTPDYDNVYLIRTNPSGDTLWTRTYGGTSIDQGFSVQPTADGGYAIAGGTYFFGAGSFDVYLIKTNASGDTLWTRTCGGTLSDCGWSVQQTADGGYIIAGTTESFGAGRYDAYLVKTDANGNLEVEEPSTPQLANSRTAFRAQPNPFSVSAKVPGHETERFVLSDISGRKVGVCGGNQIGEGLQPGVYFLSPVARRVIPLTRPLRIVKGE